MDDKKRKIRVLQVNKLYYPTTGGIERVVQQIAEGLNETTDTDVLVCQSKGKMIRETIHGVKVTRTSSIGTLSSVPLSVSFLRHFRKMAKEKDVVHIHMPFPLGDLACFLSGYRGKVVLWWHSDIVRQKKMMFFYKPLMNWLLRRADAIVVATQGHIDGSFYLKPYEQKCVIIPFGVDPKIEQSGREWTKSNHMVNRSKNTRFLFVGRLVYYKGCKTLIEAFANACRSNTQITLDVVGAGPLKQEMEDLVSEEKLEEKVSFHSNVGDEELIQFFENCDVFVLPSLVRSEAFGLVQIEAMAYGKPVINTNLPSGVPYVSLDHITGLTVEPGNIEQLTQAMLYLSENPEERNQMGLKARQRVEQEYQMDKMLERVGSLYEKIVEGTENN